MVYQLTGYLLFDTRFQ